MRVRLTEAEKQMRAENLEARPYYRLDGLRALCAAVTLQAMRDYKMALEYNYPGTIYDCEYFFEHSEIFGYVSDGYGLTEVKKAIKERMEGAKL